jgi:acetylornithine/succinyldiaminopimelate/putrescine aminotransferase/acyl-CoA synthetase (AMP-forming)/AMP-acid ligase II/predicted amino acid dehydrogenase/acyl carrier protein
LNARSIIDVLCARAEAQPGRLQYRFLRDGGLGAALEWTREDLATRALAVGAALAARGLAGRPVLLLYPPGLDFAAGFFGALAAGAVAVPTYPPDPADLARTLRRLVAIVDDASAAAVLTIVPIAAMRAALAEEAPGLAALPWIATDDLSLSGAGAWARAVVDPDAVAFLQYTSGSTGSPKGVMVRHRNMLHNATVIQRATAISESTHAVSWLPQYHDMGLISALVEPLYTGCSSTMMSPLDFLRRPVSWLEAISHFRGTHAGGPNFAFDLCARKAADADLGRLDLRSWRVAWNSAEPVRATTLRRFAQRFASAGFRAEALRPCYGLAESVLLVASVPLGRPVATTMASRAAIEEGRLAPAEDRDAGRSVELVGSGVLDGWGLGVEVVVVDPERCVERTPGEIGEIWVASPSVAAGYWRRPEETAQIFGARLSSTGRGPFLRTGDLGVVHDGQVYITGRLKDLIIVRGKNHVPADVERTVEEAHPRIRPGGVAAFDAEGTSGRLTIVAEVATQALRGATLANEADGAVDEIMDAVRRAVLRHHAVAVDEIALVPPRAVPKTSSGKVQRRECRRLLREGALPMFHRAAREATPEGPTDTRAPLTAGQAAFVAHVERAIRAVVEATGRKAEAVGPHDPLDRLGLDSLAVVELKAQIEEDLGITVPLSVLREAQTLADIAGWLESQGGTASVDHPVPSSRSIAGVAPSSRAADGWSSHVNPEVARLLRAFRLDKRYVRGEGCRVYDDTGRAYLDFTAAYGALPFGFNPKAIWAAIHEASRTMPATLIQPSLLDAAGRLARRLVEIAPPGLQHVTFANSGAEAMEAAIKLARAATGRMGVVSMERAFHGKTLGTLSATGRAAHQEAFGAPAPGFVRAPFGDLDALALLLAHKADTIAAVLVEPIQGEGGIHVAPPGYLAGVRALCDRHGVLLVFDEVQTGLGRTGAMFAADHEGVVPDVLALAKALGGGLVPIGAVLCNDAAWSDVFALRHSSTFAGNALAATVGLASIDLLMENDSALVRHVASTGAYLGEGLLAIQRQHPHVLREARGRGFIWGVELTDDGDAFERQCLMGAMAGREGLALAVCSYLLNVEKIRLAPTLLGTRVLRVEPPLIATRAECDEFLAALGRVAIVLEGCDTTRFFSHLVGRDPEREPLDAPRGVQAPRPRARPAPNADDARFGFVIHPLDHTSYVHFDAGLGAFSDAELRRLVERLDDLPPGTTGRAMRIGAACVASKAGTGAWGELVAVPATAAELTAMPSAEALSRVREAVLLARDRGARIVGLGAYSSIVTRNGAWLGDVGVPITTGNSFTVVAALDLMLAAARRRDFSLASATVAVVGATGAIGRALAIELGPHVGRLVLTGNPAHPESSRARLDRVAEDVVAHLGGRRSAPEIAMGELALRVAEESSAPLGELARRLVTEGRIVPSVETLPDLTSASIVFTATSSLAGLLVPEALRPYALVCDVSRPSNVSPRIAAERPDVTVFEGGVVATSGRRDLGVRFGLAPGLLYACMAETALLALERRFTDGTIGPDLSTDLIADLRTLAARHGMTAIPARGGAALEDAF